MIHTVLPVTLGFILMSHYSEKQASSQMISDFRPCVSDINAYIPVV